MNCYYVLKRLIQIQELNFEWLKISLPDVCAEAVVEAVVKAEAKSMKENHFRL